MLYLAIDQSSSRGSLALVRGTQMLAEREWDSGYGANQALSRALAELQAAGLLDLSCIDCYALGIGPGAYSGLRMAAAMVTACALPGDRPVYAVSSAEVLAWQLAPAYADRPIMIIGDARRDQFWYRVFRSRGLAPVTPEAGWELCSPEKLPWRPGLVVATAEWDRIGADLRSATPADVEFIDRAVYPSAFSLARLTAMRLADALPSEKPLPIYLHAAVNKPKK